MCVSVTWISTRVLEPGMTIRDVTGVQPLISSMRLEAQMNEICDKLGSASEEKMTALYGGNGDLIQDLMDAHDFYMIDC